MKITTDNTPQGKVTPLGIIPNEWKILPLQKVGKIYSGGTPDTKEPSYWNGDILWCTPSDITKLKTRFITNTNQKITQLGLKNSSATLLPPGCILVCTRATIGNAAITLKETSTNQGFKNIKPTKDINVDWLFYCIASNKHRLVQLGGGSTFLEVSKKDFEKFKIAIPPLPEQQKIAEIINTWDKFIEKQLQLIEKLELRKKGLMQQLLTSKRRLPGFSDSWKKVKLGDICSIKKGKTLSSSQVKDGIYPVIAGGKTIPYFHNEYTDQNVITISASGAYAGYVSLHENKIWASDCSVISISGKNSILRFIYALLSHKQSYIYSLQIGGAQPHVFPKDIAKINICVPTKEEQTAIAEVLTAADREIELAQQKLELLRQQKHGLMQQLLTGKKRVKL